MIQLIVALITGLMVLAACGIAFAVFIILVEKTIELLVEIWGSLRRLIRRVI
jgi:hypothetical protein